MRTCCACNESKDLSSFNKTNTRCRPCHNSYNREYKRINKEKVKEWNKARRIKHGDRLRANAKVYYKENKEAQNLKNNKNYQKNKDFILAKQKAYAKANKDKVAARAKRYVNKNRKKVQAQQNAWNRKKRASCPVFAVMSRVRSRHNGVLRNLGIRKTKKTLEYIGCTPEELILHIESQFSEGMNWENRNLWHIDHIIPISLAKTEEQVYQLCHYTNLRPLWALENIKKSNKIITPQKEEQNVTS